MEGHGCYYDVFDCVCVLGHDAYDVSSLLWAGGLRTCLVVLQLYDLFRVEYFRHVRRSQLDRPEKGVSMKIWSRQYGSLPYPGMLNEGLSVAHSCHWVLIRSFTPPENSPITSFNYTLLMK